MFVPGKLFQLSLTIVKRVSWFKSSLLLRIQNKHTPEGLVQEKVVIEVYIDIRSLFVIVYNKQSSLLQKRTKSVITLGLEISVTKLWQIGKCVCSEISSTLKLIELLL